MLSRDLQRYAELHRTLGVKFRTPYALLQLFVAHAEGLGDEFVRSGRVIRRLRCWHADSTMQRPSKATCRIVDAQGSRSSAVGAQWRLSPLAYIAIRKNGT